MPDELRWLEFFDHTGGLNTRNSATTTPQYDALQQRNIDSIVRGGFKKANGYSRHVESPLVDESSAVLMRGIDPTAESDAWTGAGPGSATIASSGGILTITEDAAGSDSERYFNAEGGFTTGTDAVLEVRCVINDGYTASGVYVTSICVLDDGTDRFELCAIESGGTKYIAVLTTTSDRTVVGSYSNLTAHDFTEFTRYRVTYDASGNVDVYINDLTTVALSIAVSSLPASTETSRVAFGSFESATTVVSRWDYLAYEIGALTLSTLAINGIYEFIDESGTRETLVVAGTGLYKVDASTGYYTAISLGTAFTAGAKPHFATFQETSGGTAIVIITTESSDTPQRYNGTTAADLGGTPPTGQFVEIYNERCWILDGAFLYFSGLGDPEDDDAGSGSWDQTNSVFAIDYFRFGLGKGLISVNDLLLIFAEKAIYRLQGWGVGSFQMEEVSTRNGCVAPNSIVKGPFGDQRREGVFFRDRDGWYWTDGTPGNVIRVSEKILTTIDEDLVASEVNNIVSFLDKRRSLVGWGVTESGEENDTCYALDYINGARPQGDGFFLEGWFPYDYPLRSAGQIVVASKERVLFGDHSGNLFLMDDGDNFDNADISGYRTTSWINGGEIMFDKIWRYMRLYLKATGDFNVNISWGINYQDNFTNQKSVNLAAGADLLGSSFVLGSSALGSVGLIYVDIPIDIQSHSIRFKFGTDEKAKPFTIFGFAVGFEPQNYFTANAAVSP